MQIFKYFIFFMLISFIANLFALEKIQESKLTCNDCCLPVRSNLCNLFYILCNSHAMHENIFLIINKSLSKEIIINKIRQYNSKIGSSVVLIIKNKFIYLNLIDHLELKKEITVNINKIKKVEHPAKVAGYNFINGFIQTGLNKNKEFNQYPDIVFRIMGIGKMNACMNKYNSVIRNYTDVVTLYNKNNVKICNLGIFNTNKLINSSNINNTSIILSTSYNLITPTTIISSYFSLITPTTIISSYSNLNLTITGNNSYSKIYSQSNYNSTTNNRLITSSYKQTNILSRLPTTYQDHKYNTIYTDNYNSTHNNYKKNSINNNLIIIFSVFSVTLVGCFFIYCMIKIYYKKIHNKKTIANMEDKTDSKNHIYEDIDLYQNPNINNNQESNAENPYINTEELCQKNNHQYHVLDAEIHDYLEPIFIKSKDANVDTEIHDYLEPIFIESKDAHLDIAN